ncbi:MAG: polyprenyl synthetase family protein [Leptospiraceae bacterium]|nr:polyprenyl synthetase family protein [Leptospiraceae bacterium]
MDKSFEDYVRCVEAYLEGPLRQLIQSLGPPELQESVLYSLLAGGKRIRPVLALVAAGYAPAENFDPFALNAAEQRAFAHASALECIHCYSLIHDDLPSMDNDDLRRGQPSNHKQFNEWAAVLAGDALNTLAFQLTSTNCDVAGLENTAILSRCALRMVAGQFLDLSAERGSFLQEREAFFQPHADSEKMQLLESIHLEKTAAMIEASLAMGAVLQGHEDYSAYAAFGRGLGLLFQMVDDFLDETQDSSTLGKTAGKDKKTGKLTIVSLLGVEGAKDEIQKRHLALKDEVQRLPVKDGVRNPQPMLLNLLDYFAVRTS